MYNEPPQPGCIARAFSCGCSLIVVIGLVVLGLVGSVASFYLETSADNPPPPTEQPATPPKSPKKKRRKHR